jgi:transposase
MEQAARSAVAAPPTGGAFNCTAAGLRAAGGGGAGIDRDSGALTVRVGRAVVQVREPEQIDAGVARALRQPGWRCRMILLPSSVRVYVATAAANLRKSFEGLSNEVRCVLGDDPLSGHVFLFLNRRGCQVKMLVWTRGGFTIVHKRLERGRFTFPERVRADAVRVEIDAHELAMLLEGLDLSSSPSARRWAPRRKASEIAA